MTRFLFLQVRRVLASGTQRALSGSALTLEISRPPAGVPTDPDSLATSRGVLTVAEEAEEIRVIASTEKGEAAVVGIDRRTGGLRTYQLPGGPNLIEEPLRLCLYRAPTDNDRGGSGGTSYAFRWLNAGLHALEVEDAAEVDVRQSDASSGVHRDLHRSTKTNLDLSPTADLDNSSQLPF